MVIRRYEKEKKQKEKEKGIFNDYKWLYTVFCDQILVKLMNCE